MNLTKRLLLAALIAISCTSYTSFAAITNQHCVTENSELDIPIVQLENKTIQAKLNKTILDAYPSLEPSSEDEIVPDFISGSYELKYEDDNYLSLIITGYTYFEGAAHGLSSQTGIVFDKKTGEEVPLDFFLNVPSMERFYEDLDSGKLPFYNGSMERIVHNEGFTTLFMSNSYYLAGDGGLYVIFQPYALGPYSDGATKVYFSKETINEYNKLSAEELSE